MKILKYPKFEPIKCGCGCIFIVESEKDIKTEITDMSIFVVPKNYVQCPICGQRYYDKLREKKND